MKSYPSISADHQNIDVYGFPKYDGSNLRAEWSRKQGFYKFGSRTRLLDRNEKPLGEGINLFLEKYEKSLSECFKSERYESAICFFEFFGENSFAGLHQDEPHQVIVFDIAPHKKGILPPQDYLRLAKKYCLDVSLPIYHGNANSDFINQVKNGTLPGMTFEGVVCKSNPLKKGQMPNMFKVKNTAWYLKLKERCQSEEEFESLK